MYQLVAMKFMDFLKKLGSNEVVKYATAATFTK